MGGKDHVEIDKADISLVIGPLIEKARPLFTGQKQPLLIQGKEIRLALLPVIEKYAGRAGRGQKISKEIRQAAIEYLEENGFKTEGGYGVIDYCYTLQ
jgi:hypothetical protein